MSSAKIDEIKNEVASNKIVIYMKGTKDAPRCGFSARAVGILKDLAVPFKDVDVLADQEKWQAVKELSDWPTIPQVYVNGVFLGGGDQLAEMHAAGDLAPLVQKAMAQP